MAYILPDDEICKLIVFHYGQLPTPDPEESGNSDDSGRNLSFETEEGPLSEDDVQLPCQPQMKQVSSTGSLKLSEALQHIEFLKTC